MDTSQAEYSATMPAGDELETAADSRLPNQHDAAAAHADAGIASRTSAAAERFKQSMSKIVTARRAPASDHFTELPGDAPSAGTKNLRDVSTVPLSAVVDAGQHVSRHSNTALFADEKQRNAEWGTEDLLPVGSKQQPARNIFEIVGTSGFKARLKLSGMFGESEGAISDGSQHCPYTAMGGTPGESPGRQPVLQQGIQAEERKDYVRLVPCGSLKLGLVTLYSVCFECIPPTLVFLQCGTGTPVVMQMLTLSSTIPLVMTTIV